MAIRIRGGRSTHVRSVEEDVSFRDDLVRALSPSQAMLTLQVLREALLGSNATWLALRSMVYEREPLSIGEFVSDPHYLGIGCKNLYPALREHLEQIFPSNSPRPYTQVVLTGSIGLGKTYLASIIFCYLLYELSCMRSPQEAMGLSKTTDLYMICLSKNLGLARTVVLAKVLSFLKESPYFQTEFPYIEGTDTLKFRKNIIVQIGSVQSERVLGLDVYAFIQDETNFMGISRHKPQIAGTIGQKLSIANYDSAERLYTTLMSRLKNRFQLGGRMSGMAIMMSSKTTSQAFTERIVREHKDSADIYVIDMAKWEVTRRPGDAAQPTFRVLIGAGGVRSKILKDGEHIEQGALDESGSMVIDVPMIHRPEFEKDLYGSIRDVAGIATDAISSFITDTQSLYHVVSPDIEHPFERKTWVMGYRFQTYWTKICTQVIVPVRGGHGERRWIPRHYPDAMRFIHIDTALAGDACGIAMGHQVRWVDVERVPPGGGEVYIEQEPEIRIDFLLGIRPQVGEYILLQDIRGLVYDLRDHGFNIRLVTTDKYQSADMLQQLRANGIHADLLSVDVSSVPYETTRLALYERRILMGDYEDWRDEMGKLEWEPITGKVDHPIGGSKDLADAVCGVVTSVTEFASRHVPDMVMDLGDSRQGGVLPPWVDVPMGEPSRGIQIEEPSVPNPRAPLKHLDARYRKSLTGDQREVLRSPSAYRVGRGGEIERNPDASGRDRVGYGDGDEDVDDVPPILT